VESEYLSTHPSDEHRWGVVVLMMTIITTKFAAMIPPPPAPPRLTRVTLAQGA
jgi:hypothetical protein